MADFELKSDNEKAEELKAWWKKNGTSVIAGVALTIGGMFGFKQWEQHKLNQSEGASKIFSQLSQNDSDANAVYKQLNDDYSGTAYTALAALRAAKENCTAGKMEECISQLRSAADSSQESVATVASIRLARALLSTGKLDEAQKILSQKLPTSYASIVTELEGDIHFATKEFQKARAAYDKAILSSGRQNTQLLKLKRDDLGDHLKSGV